ncbi:MAG: hypothetical protein DCC55_14020 [Chloroflexi bacterium]|nr:MAG: hypothetical protein DCC55_14020 [Chloroflexota bacterium]
MIPLRNEWAGIAAMMGGAIWACFHFWWFVVGGEGPPRLWFSLLGVAAVGFAVALLTLLASEQAGSGVKIGLLALLAGKLMMALGLFGVTLFSLVVTVMSLFLFVILGEMITSLGLAVFSVANLGEKRLSRWNTLPPLMTVLYIPSWMIDPGTLPVSWPAHLTELLAGLYGAGWVLLGYRLWQDSSNPAPATASR